MSRKYLVLIAGICVVAACHKAPQTKVVDCSKVGHSWSHNIVPMLTHYCTDSSYGGCHQTGSEFGDWTDYQQFKQKVDEGHVEEHCLESNEMPPPYSTGPFPLADSDKQMLRCWIDNGAQKD